MNYHQKNNIKMTSNTGFKVPLKLLLLEDSPQDAELVQELLMGSGYELSLEKVDKENVFITFLNNKNFDLILSDYNIPGFSGMQALEYTMKMCPDIPFICISGHMSEEIAVEMLKKGAVDFIMKDRIKRLPFLLQKL